MHSYALSVCFNATGCETFSNRKLDVGSVMCATILERAVYTNARQLGTDETEKDKMSKEFSSS